MPNFPSVTETVEHFLDGVAETVQDGTDPALPPGQLQDRSWLPERHIC